MDKVNNKIKAIIIDDEPGSMANLHYHLSTYCSEIEIVAKGGNINEAMNIIEKETFDVAFLDVELFDNSIFNVLPDTENLPFAIVFVTAYERYALKAFKVDALDYILKPLSDTDILHCLYKIKKHMLGKDYVSAETNNTLPPQPHPKKVILKQGEKVYIIKKNSIYYLKAKGFYTEVVFRFNGSNTSVIVSKPISALEKEYDDDIFFRIHKSYLVNVNKVATVVRNETTSAKLINEELIPIAKRRVTGFLTFLNNNA